MNRLARPLETRLARKMQRSSMHEFAVLDVVVSAGDPGVVAVDTAGVVVDGAEFFVDGEVALFFVAFSVGVAAAARAAGLDSVVVGVKRVALHAVDTHDRAFFRAGLALQAAVAAAGPEACAAVDDVALARGRRPLGRARLRRGEHDLVLAPVDDAALPAQLRRVGHGATPGAERVEELLRWLDAPETGLCGCDVLLFAEPAAAQFDASHVEEVSCWRRRIDFAGVHDTFRSFNDRRS